MHEQSTHMVLSLTNKMGKVLVQQPLNLEDAQLSGLQLHLQQPAEGPGITLSAYLFAGTVVWTGHCRFGDGFVIRLESSQPLLQFSLLTPAHPEQKAESLPEHMEPLLQAGTLFTLQPAVGSYRLLLLYLSHAHLQTYPDHSGIGQLKNWLKQLLVPAQYRQVAPQKGLFTLCKQLLAPPLQNDALLIQYVQLKVQELVLYLGQHAADSGSALQLSDREIAALEQAAATIKEHLDTPLKIAAVAKIAGIHQQGFQLRFRQYFGCTLRQYVYINRMETGRKLVIETDLPLKAIAFQVGYSNPDHFYAAFKQFYGYPAGSLRK